MLSRGEFDKAITFFKAAISKDGSNQNAWNGYNKAMIGKTTAGKDKLNINEIPRTPEEMTPTIEAKISAPSTEPAPDTKILQQNDANLTGNIVPTAKTDSDSQKHSNSIASFSSERINPWKGLSVFEVVDPTLMNSPSLARRRYNEEKRPLSTRSKDKFGTGVEAIATYVPMNLYKYLAVALGAERGWSYKETEMKFVLLSKYARKYHEFAIDIREIVSPRKYPFINDIAKRTILVDDNGNKYEPLKSAGPTQEQLKRADTYSVCYPQLTKDGQSIASKAKKYFYLTIKGLGDSRNVRKLRFNKEHFNIPKK